MATTTATSLTTAAFTELLPSFYKQKLGLNKQDFLCFSLELEQGNLLHSAG